MSIDNCVLLNGRLGADPESGYTTTGDAWCRLRIATDDPGGKDAASGETKMITEWHTVIFYRKPAEALREHARKGTSIRLRGRLRTRRWERGDQVHFSTEVIGDEFRFGPKPRAAGEDAEAQSAAQAAGGTAEGGGESGKDAMPPVGDAPPGMAGVEVIEGTMPF